MILALFAAAAPLASAQGLPQLKRPTETPEEKPPEPPKKKKVKGPRAVAVLQFTANGKPMLIPIAILVEGKFYDAGAYKAAPVPMALYSGTVYEVEQTGESQGLFTVNTALHSKTAGSLHPWVGAGSFLPNGTEAEKSTRKAEDVPVGLGASSTGGSSDAPPRLTKATAAKPPAPAPAAAPPASDSSAQNSAQDKDKDAPKAAATAASGGTPAKTPSGETSPSQSQTAAPPEKDSAGFYRPTLRRGTPMQAPKEEEYDPPATPKNDSATTAPAAAEVKRVPAISDGGGPDPRPYNFFWKTGEEDDRRNQMLALAADDVRSYLNAMAKNSIAPKPPVPKTTSSRKAPVKAVQPEFDSIRFRAFDVWSNNQPVMILSAEAHLPPAPGANAAPASYSVTLVAKPDIYGTLHKLYSGVTDKFHLDVTPRLELIDAVDADGDGHGELLFAETSDAGSGYIIYRPTPDRLWKLFDSLNAQ